MLSKQVTIYAPIVPGQDPKGHDRTGIFFPDAYVPGATVDLILYFHGLLNSCGGSGSDTVEKYWNNKYFRLREWMNNSKRKMPFLLSPTWLDSTSTTQNWAWKEMISSITSWR